MNTESDYRRSLELAPLKLVSRQSTIISSDSPPHINYLILFLVTVIEPIFTCVESFVLDEPYESEIRELEYIKFASMVSGFFSAIYFVVVFAFARDRFPKFKKREKVLVYTGLMCSIMISFLNINVNGQYTIFRLFPIVAIKSYLLFQLNPPEVLLFAFVGSITAYEVVISIVFNLEHIFLDYIESGVYHILFLGIVLYLKRKDSQPVIKQIERPGDFWRSNEVLKVFESMNDGVVLIESSCLAYSNASFRRIFRERENPNKASNSSLESVDEKESNFFMRRFSRVKNIKAKNILIQNQLKDILKNDPFNMQRVKNFRFKRN